MKKQILVAALMGCMAVQGFAQIDKIVFVHETFTISSTEDATSGAVYRWRRDGKIIEDPGAATYSGSLPAAGTYTFIREAMKDPECVDTWKPSNPFVVAAVPGTNQLQGGCTFTQPPVIGTFADFPADYSASTFVTLIDERDGNNYTVVKMPDGRWWMAQNLNYQKGLTWQAYSNSPSTAANYNPALTGHFWCPGVHYTTISSKTSCDVWGALYAWETAMMVDGKWSDDSRSSSTWEEPATYGTNTTSGNYNNDARGTTRRGICPPNWHVPTDGEWGDMLTAISPGEIDYNNAEATWLDIVDAGESAALLKASCLCESDSAVCISNNDNVYIIPPSDPNQVVYAYDSFGFRILPGGYRSMTGADYRQRAMGSYYWSSSAQTYRYAWRRWFPRLNTVGRRDVNCRSYGFSVRCVMD
jgi:uncharacterized protein (TIGR02145 family)